MDPELLQLFAAAVGGNKNVAGLLNNLNSPQLAYLSGVYDPISAGQSSGPLWRKYSSSQEPIIQNIINSIQQGADSYQLSSDIDAAVAQGIPTGMFQVGDLKGLAKALQKEYSGSSTGDSSGGYGSKGAFPSPGLRSPLDLYSTEDVPLGPVSGQDIRKIQAGRTNAEKELRLSQIDSRSSDEEVKRPKEIQKIADRLRYSGGGSTNKYALLADWLEKQPYADREAFQKKAEEFMPDQKYLADPYKNVTDFLGEKIGKLAPGSGKVQKYKKSKVTEGLAQQQANAAAGEEEAYRRGLLRAYESAGKTPLRDQYAGMFKFLSGQSNA